MAYALAVTAARAGDTFPLVDGRTEAVIVGDGDIAACVENGNQKFTGFLQTYIEKSTGRRLRSVPESAYDPKTMPHAIFLPSTRAAQDKCAAELKQLDRDAYVVWATPKAVYLLGARPHSSGWAQVDFLRTHLGVDTYLTTKWGTIVPKHKSVRIPVEHRVEVPAFTSRAFSGIRFHTEKPGIIDSNGNTEIPWRLYRRDTFSHNLHTFITIREFGRDHPEYFPEVNGKRLIVSGRGDPGPCIANPEVQQIVLRKAREFFDHPKNQDADIISLGMTDGGWCECAKCRALDGKDVRGVAAKSTRYYSFLNGVARALRESHPGKSVGVLAYAGADFPPAGLTIERNIVPYICSQRASWGDKAVREAHLKQLSEWTSRVDKVGVYEYLYGTGYLVPRLYNRHLAEYLRAVRAQSQGGFYAEIYSNHGLDGPKAWVVEKLVWNPGLDPDELRRQWCRAVFEDAAPPMDAYFTFLEECNSRNIGRCPTTPNARDSKFYLMSDIAQLEWFPLEDIRTAKDWLEKARQATRREAIWERIEYFASSFQATELLARSYHASTQAKRAYDDRSPARTVLAALIEGEAGGPAEDANNFIQRLLAEDHTKFTVTFPVSVTTFTELQIRLINDTAWAAVHAALKEGQRDLGAVARQAVLAMAPPNHETSPVAKRRVENLLAMAGRIAVATKTGTPPTIDGDLSDPVWQWREDVPWWVHKSGAAFESKGRFAFCHDGRYLYFACQFTQDDLAEAPRGEHYGVSAWKFPGCELFLNPDDRDAKPKEVSYLQVIPCLGGGLWANKHNVVTEWKVTNTADQWQAELKIDLQAVGMMPNRFPALRMNLIRNLKEAHGRGWFPVCSANSDLLARAWLIFE